LRLSVDITVKQNGFFKKNIDLNFFKALCDKHRFSFGVSNVVYVLEDYAGGEDIANVYFVVYNEKKIGRGFLFWADENKRDCHMRLNNPCTDNDVADFYDFLQSICELFKAKYFEQDDSEIKASDIGEMKRSIMDWNTSLFRQQMEWKIFRIIAFSARYIRYI